MKRTIIKIDEELCTGCGNCVPNCHEGALQIIDGKARLISDLFCDGLGACIGNCPEGAITLEEREAEPYNEVSKGGCPGSREISFDIDMDKINQNQPSYTNDAPSELRQWPVQLHLLNPQAGYFKNADVVLAADCVAFAMGNFHNRFLKGKTLAIACPKLDSNKESYVEKMTAMINNSNINTLQVVTMEVPCCSGLVQLADMARQQASRTIPIKKTVVSIQGEVLSETWI